MKMKYLSLAVASAIGSMAIPAQAALDIAEDGVGHILLVPYYTVQDGNDTLLNIVNTDKEIGKAVKVRFRSALDSDDVFDFHVYLSPADMWSARISLNPDTGVARLETPDNSCTRPANVEQDFVTGRLADQNGVTKAMQTREGYIEILTMGNIVDDGVDASSSATLQEASVYYQTKHVSGVAPCNASILSKIGTTSALLDDITAPTASLMANWTIINVPGASAWSGGATAIVATTATQRVYFDQNALQNNVLADTPDVSIVDDALFNLNDVASYTADNVLLSDSGAAPIASLDLNGTAFGWANYDLPDLSTPLETAVATPSDQADLLSAALGASVVTNEYLVIGGASVDTDWVLSMPTKRYHVAGRGTIAQGVASTTTGFYAPQDKTGAQGAFADVTKYAADGRSSCVTVGGYDYYNREEGRPGTTPTVDVISPNTPADPTIVKLCGEVTVVGVNQTGSASAVMGGSVAYTNLALDPGYNEGWATLALTTTSNTAGLPMIGQAFASAYNPAATAGSAFYGANWKHRFTPEAGVFATTVTTKFE